MSFKAVVDDGSEVGSNGNRACSFKSHFSGAKLGHKCLWIYFLTKMSTPIKVCIALAQAVTAKVSWLPRSCFVQVSDFFRTCPCIIALSILPPSPSWCSLCFRGGVTVGGTAWQEEEGQRGESRVREGNIGEHNHSALRAHIKLTEKYKCCKIYFYPFYINFCWLIFILILFLDTHIHICIWYISCIYVLNNVHICINTLYS